MSVPAAYLGVVVIWSTTPLAIKWSGEGVGFLFGVGARMVIGAALCLLLLRLLGVALPWHAQARRSYLVAGVSLFAAMSSTYWAAQQIPSGVISVVFGLSPLLTGVFAALWLSERALSPLKLAGVALGVAGLSRIFGAEGLGEAAWQGIAAVFVAVIFHSAAGVLVKRLGGALHPLALTTGSLLVAVPLFTAAWWVGDGHWPLEMPERALWSIGYLGIFGTVIGFSLYYYVLKRISAGVVSLITLVTPVTALALGRWLNGESVGLDVWTGTAGILAGLALYLWSDRRLRGLTVPK